MNEGELLYMAVTTDEFEFPLFVGSAKEICKWAGITLNNLYSKVSKQSSGKKLGIKFVKAGEFTWGE